MRLGIISVLFTTAPLAPSPVPGLWWALSKYLRKEWINVWTHHSYLQSTLTAHNLKNQNKAVSKPSLPKLNGCRRQFFATFQVHWLFLCMPIVTGQLDSRELLRGHGFGSHEKLRWESKGCFSAISRRVRVKYCAIIQSNCWESVVNSVATSETGKPRDVWQEVKVRWLWHQQYDCYSSSQEMESISPFRIRIWPNIL